jgi:transcriptional regulator with XRE-family HTH domain
VADSNSCKLKTWHDLDGKNIADVVGEFSDYDGMVERLRERAASVGLSYRMIEELTGMGEGAVGKYLADLRVKKFSIESLLRINRVLGIKAVLVVDPKLAAEMAAEYGTRDGLKAHARRLAPVGETTVKRMLPVIAKEYARRGGLARMAKMTPYMRRQFGKAGAAARWQNR